MARSFGRFVSETGLDLSWNLVGIVPYLYCFIAPSLNRNRTSREKSKLNYPYQQTDIITDLTIAHHQPAHGRLVRSIPP